VPENREFGRVLPFRIPSACPEGEYCPNLPVGGGHHDATCTPPPRAITLRSRIADQCQTERPAAVTVSACRLQRHRGACSTAEECYSNNWHERSLCGSPRLRRLDDDGSSTFLCLGHGCALPTLACGGGSPAPRHRCARVSNRTARRGRKPRLGRKAMLWPKRPRHLPGPDQSVLHHLSEAQRTTWSNGRQDAAGRGALHCSTLPDRWSERRLHARTGLHVRAGGWQRTMRRGETTAVASPISTDLVVARSRRSIPALHRRDRCSR